MKRVGGEMCAYVVPPRRCLHLFISGQMLVVVEDRGARVREGSGGEWTSSIYSLIIHAGD